MKFSLVIFSLLVWAASLVAASKPNILVNLADDLRQTKESPRGVQYFYRDYKLQAVRVGPWKVAIATQNEGMGKFGTPVGASLVKPRLYNLDTDIGERTDVAADHPDVLTRLVSVAQNGR